MSADRVLVVDDERSVRRAVAQALESLDVEVEEAVTGEEALEALGAAHISLVLLDLKMPGIGGMEVLRTLHREGNGVKVVVLTAHGTIESAVEAMKLGAVDFLEKPVPPEELCALAETALRRKARFFGLGSSRVDRLEANTAPVSDDDAGSGAVESFDVNLEHTREAITREDFDGALRWIKKAISSDPSRPEGYNIIGVLYEIENDARSAQKYYRAALSVDPTYAPAARNLTRTTTHSKSSTPDIGDTTPEKRRNEPLLSFITRISRRRRKDQA